MSLTKWSRHSIIFDDATDHFLNDDLGLLFRPKLLSSVRPRDFVAACFSSDIVPYKKYFARRHKVYPAYVGGFYPCTVRASFHELYFVSHQNPTGKLLAAAAPMVFTKCAYPVIPSTVFTVSLPTCCPRWSSFSTMCDVINSGLIFW